MQIVHEERAYMKMPESASKQLLCYLLLLAGHCLLACDAASEQPSEGPKLPSLWDSLYPRTYYHITYQLQVSNLAEVITVEEWASFDKQLFRLDFIWTSGRSTYLTYGATGERFFYKPYECSLLDGQHGAEFEAFARLFIGFPLGPMNKTSEVAERAPVAYGLGPLWLQASAQVSSVRLKRGAQEGQAYASEFQQDFDEFEVELGRPASGGERPDFKLRFFFPSAAYKFLDSLDWVPAANSHDEAQDVDARAKLLFADWSEPDESAFKLPLAYGCKRARQQSLDMNVGLVLLHCGVPNQINLDIVASRPRNGALLEWANRHYSLRLTRSSRQVSSDSLESFYASELQERSAQSGKLRKTRQVWWLPREDLPEALVYTIDQASGRCKVKHSRPSQLIELQFAGELGGGGGAGEKRMSVALSAEQVARLFDENQNFHLIDEGETLAPGRFRNRFYEWRLSSGKESPIARDWPGPISIVKQLSTNAKYLEPMDLGKRMAANGAAKEADLNQADHYRTILHVYFFSESRDRLEYKLSLDLVGNHLVDFSYLHQQLDVSDCFEADQKRQIMLKYPIESRFMLRILNEQKQQIVNKLYANLFEQPSSFLFPQQISGITPSLDAFYLRIEMTLIDLSPSHTFTLRRKKKLAKDASKRAVSLLETAASSTAKCAEHCKIHNCFRFAYDDSERLCQVELARDGAKVEAAKSDSSKLYEYFERNRQTSPLLLASSQPSSFGANELIELFQELCTSQSAGFAEPNGQPSESENILSLGFDVQDDLASGQAGGWTVLTPIELEYQTEVMNELVRESGSQDQPMDAGRVLNKEAIQVLSGSLQPEYVYFARNQEFKGDVGRAQEAADYDECAQLCAQSDCRSFSYCHKLQSCRLTQMYGDSYIKRYSQESPLESDCNVYALDSLSKFEKYGKVAAPGKRQRGLIAAKASVDSEQDCATACMDRQDFSCQGFYVCKLRDESETRNECLMIRKHVGELERDERKLHLIKSSSSSSNVQDIEKSSSEGGRECKFFSRSYLAQFDKYYSKRIDLASSNDTEAMQVLGESAEGCAKRCIETRCLAFSIGPAEYELSGQKCVLISDKFQKKMLSSEPKWTTFVLSDKSHLNPNKRKQTDEASNAGAPRPDSEASLAGQDESGGLSAQEEAGLEEGDKREQNDGKDLFEQSLNLISGPDHGTVTWANSVGSKTLAQMIGFFFGMAVGSALIFVHDEAYARGWLSANRISSSISGS